MEKLIKSLSLYSDVETDKDIKTITTFKIGGIAKLYVTPHNELGLSEVIRILKENSIEYKVFGKGSNLLCSDDYYDGVIINLSKYFNDCFVEEENILAQAGISLIYLSHLVMKNGLSGLEFASGIPATLGGAIVMNAGAYKSSMNEVVESVYVFDCISLEYKWIDKINLKFSYRHSIFLQNKDLIIIAVKLKLNKGNVLEISNLMDSRKERRLSTQPLDMPSAGSVFVNPDNVSAWELIDSLNLRGYQIGGAQVSSKHTNFIVNCGNASANDVSELIEYITNEINNKYNIELKTEVEKFNWKI